MENLAMKALAALGYDGKVRAMAHPETSDIYTINSGNENFCTIRLESKLIHNANGLIVKQKRVAFLGIDTEIAKALEDGGLLADGKELPLNGKIVIEESLEPFWEDQDPKINPSTGEIIEWQGMPVYRQTRFLEHGEDCLIEQWVAKQSNETLASINIEEDEVVEQPEPKKVKVKSNQKV